MNDLHALPRMLALLLLLALAPGALRAEDPDDAKPGATPAAAPAQAGPEDGQAANTKTPERFDPSEKISEDLSVSFPVDI